MEMQQLINDGILQEFATAFNEEVNATILLEKIGFPRWAVPPFQTMTPLAFWLEVCSQIKLGVLPEGTDLQPLVDAAAEAFPGNRVFATNRSGRPLDRVERLWQNREMPPKPEPSADGQAIPEKTAPEKDEPASKRVFLCHAHEDKPIVRDLFNRLQNDGFDPWLDEKDLLPGHDWELEIIRAIRSMDAVVICLSRHAVSEPGYFHKENKFAMDIALQQPPGRIFIIPIRLDECEIPTMLEKLHHLDYFNNRDEAYPRLKSALEATGASR